MCWNENVSLNTFLFCSSILALIMYNNYFTKYKIHEFNNIWVYLFFASVILMQLIEFFIWKNINNPFYNNIFSICATLLLIIQPVASMMILQNKQLRNILIGVYLLGTIPYSIYKFYTVHVNTVVGESGHLRWKFFQVPTIALMAWLFFLLFSFVYEKRWSTLIFGLSTLLVSYINYKKDNTTWSMWCWSLNSIMIYYAVYLLIYLPFREKMNIC